MDADLRMARRIGGRADRLLMLSSRKVYAPAAGPLAESAPVAPADGYGRDKLAAEQRLRERLGERLTVLRLANIFGYERDRRAPDLPLARRSTACRREGQHPATT